MQYPTFSPEIRLIHSSGQADSIFDFLKFSKIFSLIITGFISQLLMA